PVSEIKIDSSFITRLLDGPDNELIVRSLVDLARALGIRSVAEGVDSPGAAAALAAMSCDAAQGPSCCGPLDPAAATAWLADRARPAMIKRRGRGGTHPPGARPAGGRRRAAPAPPARAAGREDPAGLPGGPGRCRPQDGVHGRR